MPRAIVGPQILRSKNDPQTHFTQNMLARLQFPEPSEGWRRRPILFSAIVPATLSISRPIIPWVPHFVPLVKMGMRKPPNDILSHRRAEGNRNKLPIAQCGDTHSQAPFNLLKLTIIVKLRQNWPIFMHTFWETTPETELHQCFWIFHQIFAR